MLKSHSGFQSKITRSHAVGSPNTAATPPVSRAHRVDEDADASRFRECSTVALFMPVESDDLPNQRSRTRANLRARD